MTLQKLGYVVRLGFFDAYDPSGNYCPILFSHSSWQNVIGLRCNGN